LPKLPLSSDRSTAKNNKDNNQATPSDEFTSNLARLSYTPLPKSCIDSHFADGEPCSAFPPRLGQENSDNSGSNGPNGKNSNSNSQTSAPIHGRGLDVVWIWANGSDPLFQDAMYEAELARLGQEAVNTKTKLAKTKLYRYGAVLFSIRLSKSLLFSYSSYSLIILLMPRASCTACHRIFI
jgi:hypothetical protein